MAETVKGLGALNRRIQAISGPVLGVKVMRQLGLGTVREAKLLVHRKTGNLGRSIHIAEVTETHALVVASARYAPFVERGTRAHMITPNARRALRWAPSAGGRRLSGTPRVGASVVFAKRVHHPGTKPYPFLLPGAQKAVTGAGLTSQIVHLWNEAA